MALIHPSNPLVPTSPRLKILGTGLFLYFLSGINPGAQAADFTAASPLLFQEAVKESPADPSPVPVRRKHYVRIQTSALEGLPQRFTHPGWNPGFKLNLFDDVQADWTLEKIRVRPGGGWVAWGSFPGTQGGRVIMAYRGGVLEANAWVPGHNKMEIRYLGKGLHRVSEVDPTSSQVQMDGGPLQPGPTAAQWTAQQGVPTFYPQDIHSGCPNSLNLKVSQIMVLYTPLARQEAGGTTAMETLIDLAWAGMNMAFYNSGVTAEMELVHTEEVNYTEVGNVTTDLSRLSNPAYF